MNSAAKAGASSLQAIGKPGVEPYRYGFNGKENDNEVKGIGDQVDYGMRVYDPRSGRFLSVDPLTKGYPMLTPYQYAGNNPIAGIDIDGREFDWAMFDDAEKYFFGTTHLQNFREGFAERAIETAKSVYHGVKDLINNKASNPIYGGGNTTLTAGIVPGMKPNLTPGLDLATNAIKDVVKDYSSLVQRAVKGDSRALGALGFEATLIFIPVGEESKLIQGFKYSRVASKLVEGTSIIKKEIVTLTKSGTRADALSVVKDLIGDIPEDAQIINGKFGSQQDGVTGFKWVGEDGQVRQIRLDFDPEKGAHYNWTKGKQKGAVQFNSSKEQVDRMIKNEIIKSDKTVVKPAQGGN